MPRAKGPPRALTAASIEWLRRNPPEKPQRHRVADCLYVHVGAGHASWCVRYRMDGKSRVMGLGSLDQVTLTEAREKAREIVLGLGKGIDPLAEKTSRQRRSVNAPAPVVPTFRQVAEEFIGAHEAGWRNPKHGAQWTATLSTYVFPTIGEKAVDQITVDDVLGILKPIWSTKAETASRVRGRIEAVLDAAKVRGWRSGDNPAAWQANLDHLLPRKARVSAVVHHAALPWQRLPAFWTELGKRDGTAAQALRFAIVTAARSGEVRGATWAEIDLQAALWTIPASRMKGGREHRVPLSEAALAILAAVRPEGDVDPEAIVFAGTRGQALSDMALTALLRRMAWKDDAGETFTAHGFRSTFRDWAGEATHHPREVIEHALAHRLKDKAEAAYQRGDLLAKRAALMADWASFIVSTPAAVVPIRGVG